MNYSSSVLNPSQNLAAEYKLKQPSSTFLPFPQHHTLPKKKKNKQKNQPPQKALLNLKMRQLNTKGIWVCGRK